MTDIHENSHEPAQFLVQNVDILPKGQVLDVAMGSGHNAVYLAKLGFEVEGVDVSPEAINSATELARKAGVSIKVGVAGLETDYPIEKELSCLFQHYRYDREDG